MDTIGKRLKIIIESKHLSQGKFGELLNTPRQLISNYVNDLSKPSYELLTKLALDMNVNLNWLIAGTGEMFAQTPNEALKEELRKEFEELLKAKGL